MRNCLLGALDQWNAPPLFKKLPTGADQIVPVDLEHYGFGFEASSFVDDQGTPPAVGQFLIAIDPAAFAGADVFADRFAAIADEMASDGARLPGARRKALRESAARDGISVDARLLAEVRALAAS